ncbi:MAG TPA: iron-sulfur cluster-binding domain-containing protein [Candidatus Scatomorpha intestinigallinarum]|uniref:Iron-sulfur cluster-binding domain-containing protein n=1 Tax=Candidatus Scatomorpha intestinigallinarum TaxID=2840923 RepID=A0A9D1DMI3_9FIRM|nr:iron-sulfur cluster-binding domain-containing protein [Candidatus Scatomorpha intestinigallinarum]
MNVKVGLIGVFDMLKFKNLRKNRAEMIASAEAKPLPGTYRVNELAKRLHPAAQYLKIAEIVQETHDAKSFVLVPDEEAGTRELAPFKAGSYINVRTTLAGSVARRTYSLSSSPKEALEGKYRITVKLKEGGFLSAWLHNEAKVGDKLTATEPGGHVTHSGIRDCKKVVALAGGSGITPFMSMAKAIDEGTEDFEMTLLYGARTEADLVFRADFDAIAARCPKVKVVYVLSEEQKEGFEAGFITAELIKKYAGAEQFSIYAVGPGAMCDFLDRELPKLGLAQKFIRMERTEDVCDAGEVKDYTLTVHYRDELHTIPARSDETVLTAFERAGLAVNNKCRVGYCGFCRSRLVKGEYHANRYEQLRIADKQFHYFHPCCSYPMSDMEIEVYSR